MTGAPARHHAAGAPLRVVAQGESWVVVDKPAGLLSVPGKGDEPHKKDCVAARVREMFPQSTGPLIVHRLDMDTSGLLVLGLTPDAQRVLSRQFEERRTAKRYSALVTGTLDHLPADAGEIDAPLRLDPDHRPWQVVCALHGRHAVTRWRVLAREIDRTRLSLEPVTGRAHQLRVHCAMPAAWGGLGACILGDPLYGSNYRAPTPESERGVPAPAPRLMLHAAMLEFDDPDTRERIRCEIETPF